MLKALGLVIIFLSSSAFGIMLSCSEKRKYVVCKSVVDLFLYISNEIQRHKTVDNIIDEFYSDNRCKYITAKSKKELISSLQGYCGKENGGAVIEKALAHLERIGKGSNANTESEVCRAVYKEMSLMLEEIGTKSIRHRELYSKLGVICGVAFCILLA